MVNYPVEFNSESQAEQGGETWRVKTGEALKTEMSIPEEFGGDDENPSPEDLFSASLQTCMIATFKTIAEKKVLEYERIVAEASVTLDRGEDSRPIMKEAEIILEVSGVENREKAEKVAKATEKNCFIHNSVKTSVSTMFEFN